MAITETEIAKMAVNHLGSYDIADFNENSHEARAIRSVWEICVKTILAMGPWDFALKQVKLGRHADAPVARFKYQYIKPTNWVRTIAISSDSSLSPQLTEYRDFSGVIMTDAENVYLEYVDSSAPVSSFSAPFITALTYLLAHSVANSRRLAA